MQNEEELKNQIVPVLDAPTIYKLKRLGLGSRYKSAQMVNDPNNLEYKYKVRKLMGKTYKYVERDDWETVYKFLLYKAGLGYYGVSSPPIGMGMDGHSGEMLDRAPKGTPP
jgi:hypothetical protein